jgi:hypothetical protein
MSAPSFHDLLLSRVGQMITIAVLDEELTGKIFDVLDDYIIFRVMKGMIDVDRCVPFSAIAYIY